MKKAHEHEMFDLVIVGAGPAGLTAGVYAARKRMKTLVVSENIGGQTLLSGMIENYLGFQLVSGQELAKKFRQHLGDYKDMLDLHEGERVEKVSYDEDEQAFVTVTDGGKRFLSKTAIIATGRIPKKLNVPGEGEFKNRGVTYCATCDGPLFSGKTVAVIGGGNSALEAAVQLTDIARKVFLININEALGGDEVLREKVKAVGNVEVINNARTTEILGDKMVSGIRLVVKDEEKEIRVEGVFVETGSTPVSELVQEVKKNDSGEIRVDCANCTSIPGLFAAGDVTDVPEKQIIVAAGEGSKAVLSAFRYIVRTA